jgi:hypothetical protein
LVTKCEVVDSTDLSYLKIHSALPNEAFLGYNIAYRDENNILIYGHQDSTRIGQRLVNKMVLKRYTNRAMTNEIIDVPEIAFYHNIWTSISYPSDNHIYISMDTLELLGVINYKEEYKYYSWILASKDNGKTWKPKYLDSNYKCQKLTMIDSVNGFLLLFHRNNYFNKFSGVNYTLLKTTDGWETYDKVNLPADFWGSYYVYNLDKYAFKCRNQELEQYYLKITTDGGETWIDSYFDKYCSQTELRFFNNIIYSSGHYFYENYYEYKIPFHKKSTDNGLSWIDIRTNVNNEIYPYKILSIDWFDENNAVAYEMTALYKTQITKTSDGGRTWITIDRPFLNINGLVQNFYHLRDIILPSEDFVIAPLYTEKILKWDSEKTLKAPVFVPLLSEFDNSVVNKTIKWSKIEGAEKYRFFVKLVTANDILSFDNFLIDTVLYDTSFTLYNIAYKSDYHIFVQAIGSTMESDYSKLLFRTIENDSIIVPPGLIYPKAGSYLSAGDIRFIWEKIPDAETYSLTIRKYVGVPFNQTVKTEDTTIVVPNVPAYVLLDVFLWSVKTNYKSKSAKNQIFIVPSTTDVEELNKPLQFDELLVYPNPVQENCFIHFDSEATGTTELTVYSLLGAKLYSQKSELIQGRNIVQIESGELSPGAYSIQLVCGNIIKKGMFVKR